MPLPLILGIAAGVSALYGVGAGVKGVIDITIAKKIYVEAQKRDEENRGRHKAIDEQACKSMDKLGALEMNILSSFKDFADLAEKIKNRPAFAKIKIGNVDIPKIDYKKIEKASAGAAVLVGGLGGAALGTVSGFAASGATTAAVMALGTASTGTAISSLTGVAATNATLAALGGGSIAAGGGGMALGSVVLGGATLGVGLLVGGVIFSLVGSNISDKADIAFSQMLENEKVINKICKYLEELDVAAKNYYCDLYKANEVYKEQFTILEDIVKANIDPNGTVDWRTLSDADKTTLNNVVLLVGLLFQMCKVKIVRKFSRGDKVNIVNTFYIEKNRKKCREILEKVDPSYSVPK